MKEIAECKRLLQEGSIEEVKKKIQDLLIRKEGPADELYYLLGNAYRKQQNWQMAINNYSEAISINPESPACEARSMLLDILNFYHKDLYNP